MISTQRHDDILEILINNALVNALSAAVCKGLADAIFAAQRDDRIKVIVIRGEGKLFFGGADISEFGAPLADPGLPEVVDAIEASKKPVLAAIHGVAFGGGLEVALACHYRIATSDAKLGLPEVKLGILPGAGGTQRLPRLIGAEAALDMIVSGNPVSAKDAADLGLIDRLAEPGTLVEDALAFARSLGAVRRTGEMSATADAALFERYATENRRLIDGLDAPKACVEAVKAATEVPLRERASDIDVVWVYGYGWPRHTGGPLCWADQMGLENVVEGLQRYRDTPDEAFA